MEYLAHCDFKPDQGKPLGEPLIEHLRLVADRAKDFASTFSAAEEAYVAGLLHDLGKYGEAFQRRLRGELKGVDHWSAGAWHALRLYELHGVAIALAIQGHHIGLQAATKDSLGELDPTKLQDGHPLRLIFSYATPERLFADGASLPQKEMVTSILNWGMHNASSMLDVRMLFSALVDADFLETEAWFNRNELGNRRYRPPALPLSPDKALSALKEYVQELAKTKKSSPEIRKLRNTLFESSIEAGKYPQGLFTLTAPTGSGKTLAMLAFALTHAAEHNLRRIVVVLPYLTLIEQTAKVYREVFQRFVSHDEMERYLLEDHSLSQSRVNAMGSDDETDMQRLLSENWDAPIIITTNVQFLESLFSSRPAACRKLHRLARSVILFDEVQTLPLRLVIPTLGVLSRLGERYSASVVFATATQPAFSHLNEKVKEQCTNGWQPLEIVPEAVNLFSMVKRNKIILLDSKEGLTVTWDDIAQRIASERQALCIVNTKKHARILFEKVKAYRPGEAFHLSTNMCPAHRIKTLERVQYLLEQDSPCCLISTQCVEAGVDIDFPVVFRALGPLDAIAQAAGRCNRNSLKKTGTVFVFRPEDESYPDSAYEQATDVTRDLLTGKGLTELDTLELELFQSYYRRLYSVRGIDRLDYENDELLGAIKRQDFVDVALNYQVIPKGTLNVIVPYDKNEYRKLEDEVKRNGLTYRWIVRARPYSVSLFRPRSLQDALYTCLEQINIKPDRPEKSDEWYIYIKEEDYDLETGLNPSLKPDVIIA